MTRKSGTKPGLTSEAEATGKGPITWHPPGIYRSEPEENKEPRMKRSRANSPEQDPRPKAPPTRTTLSPMIMLARKLANPAKLNAYRKGKA